MGLTFSGKFIGALAFLNGVLSILTKVLFGYFVVNFLGSYNIGLNKMLKNINVFVQVNNIFDKLYASYATGGDFFPAAERNFIGGVKFGI